MQRASWGVLLAFALMVTLATPAQATGRPKGCPSLWCGCWLAIELHLDNARGLFNLAMNWPKYYGRKVPAPQVGAVGVFRRRGGGHVGVVTDVRPGEVKLKSGNTRGGVAEAWRSTRHAVAWLMP